MTTSRSPVTAATPPVGREVLIRRPALADAAGIHRLVVAAEALDVNSLYLYLLLCRDFSATCRVAEAAGELIGFVSAYRPPSRPDLLFIWQIAVASTHRRQGLAMRMLLDLLAATGDSPLPTLATTITDSNAASRRLFESLARRLRCELRTGRGFESNLFGTTGHEAERMFYLGPLKAGFQVTTGKEPAHGNGF